MSEAVLDASAILAVLQKEPGWEKLTGEILDRSIASAVNLAEVQSKLVKKGVPASRAWANALVIARSSEPFTTDQARIAGDLIAQTEKLGLSLGDRACLALAVARKAEVYTTEQQWRNLKVGVPIHVIR